MGARGESATKKKGEPDLLALARSLSSLTHTHTHHPHHPTQLAFTGAMAVADLVKTTLGPKGMVRGGETRREKKKNGAPALSLSPPPPRRFLNLPPLPFRPSFFFPRTKSCSPSPGAGA
jgi:hypothetical protein